MPQAIGPRMTNRSSQCAFITPPSLKASTERSCRRHVRFPSPLRKGFGFPLIGNEVVRSSVVRLVLCCSPHAILRAISQVIILPFYRMFRRGPSPHVLKEGFRRIEPPLAYQDPTSSIEGERGVIRVCRPTFYLTIDVVLLSPPLFGSPPVGFIPFPYVPLSPTATAFLGTATQVLQRGKTKSSTFASADEGATAIFPKGRTVSPNGQLSMYVANFDRGRYSANSHARRFLSVRGQGCLSAYDAETARSFYSNKLSFVSKPGATEVVYGH